MFRCSGCGNSSAPYEKPERVVLEKRERVYTETDQRGRVFEVGEGWEIVREVMMHKRCAPSKEWLEGATQRLQEHFGGVH